ncbi:hypothetical protein IMG5_075380 [Ichthyophthirius multifiliis]|uniref:pyridoxal 5'-phosphate synthase (glutamine hydrolyzing) n=1 Tax=Ichthyophthirius multifiliis TaxID=5932 RepID=G0QQ50_ICHMU|nr:hypothetical protein IMG5_075380 [Ichthyophthirius multifiliis]EGR32654.1 hypothetical protein IMG5_075380 [Ichthyophthirius multifiliis]|eukprot:XP_004036640.1 hypothetical protein IMG5_075380 [Ichthyophthirius multifiliis]
MATLNIGVLSLQGAFIEHCEILQKISNTINVIDVRHPHELKNLDALILPGGESTTQGILLEKYQMLSVIQEFVKSKPVWGICAGAIMLSEKVSNQQVIGIQENVKYQPLIGGLNITVNRNYFGRQTDSAIRRLELTQKAKNFGLSEVSHFIRAPAILKIDNSKVDVLATTKVEGENQVIVAVQQFNMLATVFHPEITNEDYSWHSYFLNIVRANFCTIQRPLHLEHYYGINDSNTIIKSSLSVKVGFLKFLKGGVIMDVVNATQAKIAEAAGACAVMALEKIPADIKADGSIARMSDPRMIKEVLNAVSIPIMAKSRIGHFGEAQILQTLGVDCIDESEVLTAADQHNHIDKSVFKIPFVCGAKDLGEALRRISEGASMIRMKGDAGTGNVVEAVKHTRSIFGEIRRLQSLRDDEIYVFAKQHQVNLDLVREVRKLGRLPVVTFAAGGIATPADVILLMELGVDGVFVGSGIFKSDIPEKRARAIVEACSFYKNKEIVAKVSENLGKPMVGMLMKGEAYAYAKL